MVILAPFITLKRFLMGASGIKVNCYLKLNANTFLWLRPFWLWQCMHAVSTFLSFQ